MGAVLQMGNAKVDADIALGQCLKQEPRFESVPAKSKRKTKDC